MTMAKSLGLDLGTNSIGWAVVSKDEAGNPVSIADLGCRIIPMSQDTLGKFGGGVSISQTAERTGYRRTRRSRERHLLRRERLFRVLHVMGFLPAHHDQSIDFEVHPGKFLPGSESKLPWKKAEDGRFEFIFQKSFEEMLSDFSQSRVPSPEWSGRVPYDWTIYYLRKKSLRQKIEKEELAWILLNFNQKRGYYQLRGEEEEEHPGKLVELHVLKVVDVTSDGPRDWKTDIWYNVLLENGWVYRRSSKTPLFDWCGKTREFIVTTDLNDDGSVKKNKEGIEKRSFRSPSSDDWTLQKKRTELEIRTSHETVGSYIYDSLLHTPGQKIRGKLVRTIEREFYKDELRQILEKQREFHEELNDTTLLQACASELYPHNEIHRKSLLYKGFTGLFLDDIIFYQRPLKSKKSLISNCQYETRSYKNESGALETSPIKCIPRSHPLFQEFRLWQFIHNLRIKERVKMLDGQPHVDADVTAEFLPTEEERVRLFDWLNNRKAIKQDVLLRSFFKIKKGNNPGNELPYRWNYVEDKEYPCNETRSQILDRLSKAGVPARFLDKKVELSLWHILYSVVDKRELAKALQSFASQHQLDEEFIEVFEKIPPFEKEYGSYSEKAIKKLLPLMRIGKYWNESDIQPAIMERICSISERLDDVKRTSRSLEDVSDDCIPTRMLRSFVDAENPYAGLNTFQACYAVYGRHSETSDATRWETPRDIDRYLREFRQHSLHNPIVEQIILETLRVVRDIWEKHGEIDEIHVELGRDMKNSATERARMTSNAAKNKDTNTRIRALLTELQDHADVENVRPYSPKQQEVLKIYEDYVLNSVRDIPGDILEISKQSRPTRSELIRYKLWLEQKYRSPYTGEIIPLSKLFTSAYEIEHIIPRVRYFDDSLSNKVICESNVNKLKDKQFGHEFVKNHEGEIVDLGFNKSVRIRSLEAYENFVRENYRKNSAKQKKLLVEDIPTEFVKRQLNDSRYISKFIKGLLSNIVRDEDERESTSKNLISCTGGTTATLKRDWGLDDVWNRIITPRFERMNQLTQSEHFGQWVNKYGKVIFQVNVPTELQAGFSKKRIDHRHHALDAIVIACTTRGHIQYLNNEHALSGNDDVHYGLKRRLCDKLKGDDSGNREWKFRKPWDTFTSDAIDVLGGIVISFKQNQRVINKTVNHIQSYKDEKGDFQFDKDGNYTKVRRKQINGDNWAIRKPLHKETVAGHVNLRFKRRVSLVSAIDQWEQLVDKVLRKKIKQLIDDGLEKKGIRKFFASRGDKWEEKDVSKPEVYYFSDEREALVASRATLDISFNSKRIASITDTGIQKILLNHLMKYSDEKDGHITEHPELAFTPEGIEKMNSDITSLNGGKFHYPVLKVRTYESMGSKFNVGSNGNKKHKFVEAAKGTNLFFAIYVDEYGRRSYETIPFNIVVERLKQGLREVPDRNEKGDSLLFSLSPNDLVYVPTNDELIVDSCLNASNIRENRIYKMISATESQCFFIPHHVATPIMRTVELGSNNKSEHAWDGVMIKQVCLKIALDRLGKMRKYQ
jgi:CRISPR-associated endonuclease Csn1